MIVYKNSDIQNVLNLLNEIPVTGLKGMERMVAAATILENGTVTRERNKEASKEKEEKTEE